MSVVVLPVLGGGGWTAVGAAFPANQNDGDNGTYQGIAGNTVGSNDCTFDTTGIPNGAQISDVTVSGLWGAGSAPATASMQGIRAGISVALGVIGDVASYSFSIPRPGGGTWTKADVAALTVRTTSLGSGNGNFIRQKSMALTVTYTLGGNFFIAILH